MKKLPTLQKSQASGWFRDDNCSLADGYTWSPNMFMWISLPLCLCPLSLLLSLTFLHETRHFNACALMKKTAVDTDSLSVKKESHMTARAVCFSFLFSFSSSSFYALFCILAHGTTIRDAVSQSLLGVLQLSSISFNRSPFVKKKIPIIQPGENKTKKIKTTSLKVFIFSLNCAFLVNQ